MASDFVLHGRSTQQQPVTSQVDLSFDEVANLFSLPIAEAASTLGVSTNDLKRVCRENGLSRWPYRKIVAGKTVEDIKKEAAREMAISERMSRTQQPQLASNAIHASRPGTYGFGTPITTERDRGTFDTSMQQPSRTSFYGHASSLKSAHVDQRPQLNSQFHLRVNIPTYLDEFRHGFPSKGLSTVSNRWWGNSPKDEKVMDTVQQGMMTSDAVIHEQGIEEQEKGSDFGRPEAKEDEKNGHDSTPSGMLVKSRKTSALLGRKSLALSVTKGYGTYRLGDRDEAVLRAIFADAFPALWKASLSN